MTSFLKKETDLGSLYEKYADMMFRVALANTGNKEDAEDAVQEVFAKYLEKFFGFNDEEHEKAWFIRATVNKCRDTLRKNKIRDHTPLEDVLELPQKEKGISLKEKLEMLPDKIRSAVVLHYLEGFSVEEVGEILKITPSAVKMRLKRGREALKELLGEEE